VDFEYKLTKLQDDKAFTVAPLTGVVPANGSTMIHIQYQPISYCTSTMRLQLDVSQFNFKPLVCTITGYCAPGVNAVKEISMESTSAKNKRVASPLERSRQKKAASRKNTTLNLPNEPTVKPKKMIEGLRIPEKIETVHHVSTVLMQTPGKLTLKELIEAEKSVSGRQMKENRFEQAVRKNVYEERQNQLRWQVKLGDEPMVVQDKAKVVSERQHCWALYQELRGDPTPSDEKERKDTDSVWRRTIRDCSQLAEEGIQFDLYSNNPWSTRHSATDRFTQAARKIILRIRATKNLQMLNTFLKNWNKKQELFGDEDVGASGKRVKRVPVIDPEDEEGSESSTMKLRPILASSKVTHAKYPFFVPPNKKDELAPDALNEVVTYETEVDLVIKTPFFDLQVPAQSRLLGYNEHEIHLGYDYVEPVLARELRTGAEEEIVNLVKPHEAAATRNEVINEKMQQQQQGDSKKQTTSRGKLEVAELRVEDIEKHEIEEQDVTSATTSLSPPEAMFRPIEYPPLHIFNATPGLQVFQSPVPYAEVDSDYHLCPLPKYIVHCMDTSAHKQTQKQFLDREDVIKGTMSWKKFPSQGLTSLANAPTLTNVWVPRWSDPFSNNMLPLEVPQLQIGLAQDDMLEYGEPDSQDDEGIQLTPEMIGVQFDTLSSPPVITADNSEAFPHGNKLPNTYLPVSVSGPIPREQREVELDQFLSKRSNRLGQKFNSKISQLNSQTTRDDLIFK